MRLKPRPTVKIFFDGEMINHANLKAFNNGEHFLNHLGVLVRTYKPSKVEYKFEYRGVS